MHTPPPPPRCTSVVSVTAPPRRPTPTCSSPSPLQHPLHCPAHAHTRRRAGPSRLSAPPPPPRRRSYSTCMSPRTPPPPPCLWAYWPRLPRAPHPLDWVHFQMGPLHSRLRSVAGGAALSQRTSAHPPPARLLSPRLPVPPCGCSLAPAVLPQPSADHAGRTPAQSTITRSPPETPPRPTPSPLEPRLATWR